MAPNLDGKLCLEEALAQPTRPTRPRRAHRLLGPFMVASLFLFPTAPSPAAEPPVAPLPAVGTHFHAMWTSYTDAERIEVLDKLADAGVEWVRIDIGWSSLQEVGPNSYSDWYVDQADFVIDAANERGIKVLGMLWRTPAWANGGRNVNVPPRDFDAYGEIARWAAEHFRGRVAAWEVWNEPNLDGFWDASPADIAKMLRASYDDFKAGDPDAEVVMGAPVHNDVEWLRKVYAAGAQGYFDVMATHPYPSPSNLPPEYDDGSIWNISAVERVHALMEENGDGDKPIWFTEIGWSSHPNTGGEAPWELGVSKQQQADYLVRAAEMIACRFPYVEQIFWYAERNLGAPPGASTSDVQLGNFGLMENDLTPKPAYDAMSEMMNGSQVAVCADIKVAEP